MKRIGQRGGQHLCDPGIALEKEYIHGLHKALDHGRFARQLRLQRVVKYCNEATEVMPKLPALGQRSNGSAWILPFCFRRISTLPSASSNSLRQEAESCMPSSNRVSDFSSGTSPCSSSWTIFSRR